MISYKLGNLMECDEKVLCHGTNAQGVMGSGVAKAVRNIYPTMYEDYINHHKNFGLAVGEILISSLRGSAAYGNSPTPHYGINAVTQECYGRKPGWCYVSYTGIQTAFRRINTWMGDDIKSIAIPKIGAGLGGGDWDKIISIIESEMVDKDIVVYVIDEKELLPSTEEV